MSPGLLSKRLKEMEGNGLISRQVGKGSHAEYVTTAMADELQELIYGLGAWAHSNVGSDVTLKELDARALMWNIRRNIDQLQLPGRRVVIQFIVHEGHKNKENYWMMSKPGVETDLCSLDPRCDVDLYVAADLRALTSAWMGYSTFKEEIASGAINLTGDLVLARTLSKWLVGSGYAQAAQQDVRPKLARTAG